MSQVREYGAETLANSLIAWLNNAREKPRARKSYERISKLRDLLLAASQLSVGYKAAGSRAEVEEYPAFVIAAEELLEQMNDVLRFYKLQTCVRELRLSAHRWFIGWNAQGRGTFETTIPLDGVRGVGLRFGEADALMRLIELSQSGYLDRVRTCRQCENWFYAKVAHGRFCQVSCQQDNFRTSEEFRGKRREYMRRQRKRDREAVKRTQRS